MLCDLQVFVNLIKGLHRSDRYIQPVRPVLVEPWRRAMVGGVPGGSAPESTKEGVGEDEELTTNPF